MDPGLRTDKAPLKPEFSVVPQRCGRTGRPVSAEAESEWLMRVALKECSWRAVGEDLVIVFDPRESITLEDPEGKIGALLTALGQGPRSIPELRAALGARGMDVTEEELGKGVEGLVGLGLIERAGGRSTGDPVVDERHFSNLAFFGTFMRPGPAPHRFPATGARRACPGARCGRRRFLAGAVSGGSRRRQDDAAGPRPGRIPQLRPAVPLPARGHRPFEGRARQGLGAGVRPGHRGAYRRPLGGRSRGSRRCHRRDRSDGRMAWTGIPTPVCG